eukprot:TRINITY_DN13267_c0_g1_i1.p1 TRINITY_DN13267_c0_g1~~TRINITY_DN13267_c0_g1_i1.p1  ORF type:complete len:752 (-),score=213.87 TRINITY_DN13267_c0_g1_i1:29-1996(-)
MFMYDAYQSRQNSEEFTVFNLDDVDAAFDNFVQLKYSQRYTLSGKGIKLEITPYAAGHLIGGTIWKIKRETDEIIYAVDYNHKKERHLSPTILETLTQPTLLITDALNALNSQDSRGNRDSLLIESITSTLRAGGNVLLPVDTAGRVLELLVILDQHWSHFHYSYPLLFLNNVAYNTIEFAKSQLEWMSEAIMNKFISHRENCFQFSNVKLCHKTSEVNEFPSPKVVLASMSSLNSGFAQDIFVEWCSDAKNRIIFTDTSRPGTIARRLMENPKMGKLYMERCTRVPLSGQELADYERQKKIQKEQELARKKVEEEMARKKREQIEMYDYEGEDADMTASLSTLWQGHDLYPELIKYNSQSQSQGKESKLPHPMYPCIEKKSVFDEYGESIRPEDYIAVAKTLQPEDAITQFRVEEDAMVEDVVEETPTKSIRQKCELAINCAIQYIDFEGRSDGRSIKKILNHVQPRKLILIHGSPEATEHLVKYCSSSFSTPGNNTGSKRVVAPRQGESVDVTEATNLYRLNLKSTFLESLDFKPVGSKSSVAYVEGIIMVPPQEQDEDGQWHQPEPYLDVLPHTQFSEGHDAVFVGDVKLLGFRQKLQEVGFKTEMKGGVLVVNGTVALRRAEGNASINIEGSISEDYYKIRDLLYNQFQIL